MNINFRKPSPNHGGTLANPSLIVMHWTGDNSADGAISWLCNPVAQASAHLVIDRSGQITQLVPFTVVAWHAGRSEWKGKPGCNQYSIGIELVNCGELKPAGDKSYRSDLGRIVPAAEAVQAENGRWYHAFTTPQLDAAMDAVRTLLGQIPSLVDLCGHSEICPGRKSDPGPLFPMAKFRGLLEGRA
jgi:N-acetylmuramoyl-L-alanine amidase